MSGKEEVILGSLGGRWTVVLGRYDRRTAVKEVLPRVTRGG